MADFLPPVVGRLLGDVTDFKAKMGEAQATYQETASQAESRSAAITQTVGKGLVAAGAAATGIGAVLTHMGDESKKASDQLRVAVENAGGSMDELGPRINSVSNHLIKFGIDDEATARALATLTTSTQNPTKALDEMGLVADIAAARHISLESAADKVAKGLNGNSKVFKEFGITLGANATAEEKEAAMAELAARVHGQAAAQADNFSTKMESLRIRAENVAEAVGQKVGPAITIAGPLMAGLGGIIQSGVIPALISGVGSAASFAVGMVSAGVSAAAAAIPVIIAWAPVILAIAAIGVAAYLLYKNWDEVWGFVKDIASTAADWITGHLELIAEAIFLPFAPLILLVTHWDEAWSVVKNITSAAWSWLVDTIGGGVETVVGIWFSLPGRAAAAMDALGADIVGVARDALSSLWDAVSGGISDVVDLASRLPGQVVDAVGDLGDLLWDAGQDIVRGLVNGIGSMGGWLWDQVTGFISRNIPGPVRKVLGMFSPSRVMAGLGVNVAEGLAMGIGQGSDLVASAAGDLANAAVVAPSIGSFGVTPTGGGSGSPLAGIRGGTVIHLSPTIEINTATGDIPEATLRKFRDAFFRMLTDLPPGTIVPA